ncbi:MAG: two-component regulator propeller domain-containing protein [Saprospiraceae bacterium]
MRYVFSLALCVVINLGRLFGQQLASESLTIDDGLSQGMVFDILQTRDGFLWIATKDGLNRYDGYNFNVWSNDMDNPFSLADNTINALFEDSRGWLWIGCEYKGLQLFDRTTDRFYHFDLPILYNKGNQIAYDIRQIAEDREGNIWVVNRGSGVFRLQIPESWKNALPDTAELSSIAKLTPVSLPVSEQTAPGTIEEFRALLMTKEGNIWVGTSQNLYNVNPRSLAVSKIPVPQGMPRHCWSLIQLESGEIWGATDTGVFRYRNGLFDHFAFAPQGSISDTYPALSVSKNGQLWVLFEKKLWRVSKTGAVDFQKPDYIADRSGNVLFHDDLDNIWIGTLGYGLRKITLRKSLFNAMLEGISVWGIWKTQKGEVLCKLFNKIVRLNPVTGKLSEQSAFPNAPAQQNDLLFEPDGSHWLLCGLREGDVNFSEIHHYSADGVLIKSYPITIGRYPYACLMKSRDGAIWAAGAYGKLLRLVPSTGKQTVFDFGSLFGDQAETLITYAIVEDGIGQIWAGTQYGLVKATLNEGKMDFRLFKSDGQNKMAPNNNSISCLFPDPEHPEHLLWIGTKGGGINRLDLRSETFSYITTDQGLPNNVVYGIVADQTGHFWCSTNRGLAKIEVNDPEQLQITPFTAGDGLQSNEFNTQAFYKASDGELLFGGVNGINRFYPKALQFSSKPPQIYIVGLKVNYLPARLSQAGNKLDAPVEYLPRLELDYASNNLSFEFAVMDFTDPEKNQYRYQLLPIEKNWVPAHMERFAHYTHLAPGTYVFRVQGSNSVGVWNEVPVEMTIVIHPPWWLSKPAYLAYALMLVFAVWQIWRFQVNRVKLKAQLAYEHREAERIKAIEQLKTNFFSNVTHEFRTPLSLILEPARRILAKTSDPQIRENASHVETNSLRLLNMVNQLLDLAKLESKSMGLDLRHSDLTETVEQTFRSFLPLAEQRGIHLTLSIAEGIPPFLFDPGKTELVLNNLLSNALKFTKAGGEVKISVDSLPRAIGGGRWTVDGTLPPIAPSTVPRQPSTVYRLPSTVITVSDTGIGIPPEALGKVFDRFYQVQDEAAPFQKGVAAEQGLHMQHPSPSFAVDRGGAGTGIGLALSKEFAELMGGGISVESEVGKGTTFTFWLPVKLQSASMDTFSANEGNTFPSNNTTLNSPPIIREGRGEAGIRGEVELPVALIIEDNAELRQFIKQSISDYWQVEEASDGGEGVKKAIELIPDLVISDLMMPVMDGFAVCEALKNNELTAHIPVILLTARANLESKLTGLRTGADDYLTKPFHTEELLTRMGNLIEVRRKLSVHYSKMNMGIAVSDLSDGTDFLSPPDKEFLRRFIAVLDAHLEEEKLGVEEFAQKMFISRSQLHRKLKALLNQNATDFIRDYRLDKAMEMLKNQEGLVNEIASRVGFSNEKYFSTMFKEKFGISPSRVGQ